MPFEDMSAAEAERWHRSAHKHIHRHGTRGKDMVIHNHCHGKGHHRPPEESGFAVDLCSNPEMHGRQR